MLEEIKNIKTEKKELRNFGIILGIILLIISGFLLWKEKESFQIFLSLGFIILLVSTIKPSLLKPIYWIWMVFAVIIGWFMTRIILSLLFYILFTSIGLTSRLFGKQFLELHWDNSKDSYWNYRSNESEKVNYEKQF